MDEGFNGFYEAAAASKDFYGNPVEIDGRATKGGTETSIAEPEDAALHQAAWEETQHETERGWIWEDTSGPGGAKIIAHRFGIRQNEKVRVIDNFKQCGLNDFVAFPRSLFCMA